jgi:hypothetical protein
METRDPELRQPDLAEADARNRLISSSTFARSRRLIKLLEFTIDAAVDGRAQDIKEYTIGTEVYARGPDFDPRADGIVRVEANRLRQKLAEYYQGAGLSDPIRIDDQKGAYIPEFRYSAPTSTLRRPSICTPTWRVLARTTGNFRLAWPL